MQAPDASIQPTSPTIRSQEANHRILIVDDNEAIHNDFRKILCADTALAHFEAEEDAFFGRPSTLAERPRFELDFASQGNVALEMVEAAVVENRPYAVVFMDIRMPPGWDGIKTTARLWEADPHLQVVVCTAFSDYSWSQMTRELGRTDRWLILKKPFEVIEVLQCAHSLVTKWNLAREARQHEESLKLAVQLRTRELEQEIMERKRNQEAHRITQSSVDFASDAMFRINADSCLTYVNESICHALGRPAKELLGTSVLDILPELRGIGWDAFWESLHKDRRQTFETHCITQDGRKIPVELTVNLFDFDNQSLVCASARDITRRTQILAELAAARDEALESVRLKSQFLANMSHEIRTPMNGVIGMGELLLHTNLDREQREYTNIIRNSAEVLLDIINDILDSSKIESGTMEFDQKDFDLHEIVEGALDLVTAAARAKSLELAGCVRPDVYPALRGDAGRIKQVLTNIVGNAIKFTTVGEVTLVVSRLEETRTSTRLRFEVRDTGIGIAPDSCRRIFEPFHQADVSNTRTFGGTGLGLAISKQLVEAMGGEIGVESEPAVGSTFWFTLSFEKQAERADTPLPLMGDGQRILVVDDNATNRQILRLQLANLQLASETAASGFEALDRLREEAAAGKPFPLAIIDMQMPEMDGLALASEIKADPAISDVRLIVLSSLGKSFDPVELRSAGIDEYIVKPVKHAQLQASIAALFDRSPNVPESPPPPADSQRRRKLRILIAEDNPVNQKVALLQLQRLGCFADVASDGIEALAALDKQPYDLVFVDCQMPRMDGYEAVRRIREKFGDSIRIVAMTANAMSGAREKCLAAGMDDYLSKPVRPEDIQRIIEALEPSRPAAREPDASPVDLTCLLGITGQDAGMIRGIVRDYLEQADEALSHLLLAIERRDARGVQELSHKLGGSSASCGMVAIVPVLARLERFGATSQLATARTLHAEALFELGRIRRFLIRYLASLEVEVRSP
jgi:two-component system sensor histidine kinase/response regulator